MVGRPLFFVFLHARKLLLIGAFGLGTTRFTPIHVLFLTRKGALPGQVKFSIAGASIVFYEPLLLSMVFGISRVDCILLSDC